MHFLRQISALLVLLCLAAAPAPSAIPIHGTALGPGPNRTTIVRTDPVTGMLAGQTRAFRITPPLHPRPGTGIDAFLDRSTVPWRLYDASIAAKFEAGLPETGKVVPIDYGSPLPHTKLVNQTGRFVDIASDFRGKIILISFIFTRCPDKDECPLVSAKFEALQQRLDPARFHLIEVTLDPLYDSPAVLQNYAAEFGAKQDAWSIVTGQEHDIQHLLDRFGISSLPVSDAKFIHNDKLFVTGSDGKIAAIDQGVAFDPDSVAAQARHLAGMSSNPFGRLKLAIIAGAVALCGGSQFAGIVLLETILFLIIAVVSFVTLGWVARKIWRRA